MKKYTVGLPKGTYPTNEAASNLTTFAANLETWIKGKDNWVKDAFTTASCTNEQGGNKALMTVTCKEPVIKMMLEDGQISSYAEVPPKM
ncbi:MAG: hypothetical protein OXT65_04105 [Alphaproteobacteria bacterium]|nr:hypothetical protein [Alphaproteobacteria bacterium]